MVDAPDQRVRRGEIYWVDFSPSRGSEQRGRRPCLVVQNDIGNTYARTTIVAAITSAVPKREYPFNVAVPSETLPKASIVKCDQLMTIDVERLGSRPLAMLAPEVMEQIDEALRLSLGLPRP